MIVRRPDDYLVGLYRFRSGDELAWIDWFAGICIDAAAIVADLIERIEGLIQRWEASLSVRSDATARRRRC